MKTIYYSSIENPEVQGMFDEKGNCIDSWSSDDGNWRGEYFDGFLSKLGIKIDYSRLKKYQSLLREIYEEEVE